MQCQGLLDCLRHVVEETHHLGRRFKIPLSIGCKAPACPVDGQVLADAGEHVLQSSPLGMVIEHVIDGDERHPGLRRNLRALHQTRAVIATIEHCCCKPYPAWGSCAQSWKKP